MNIITNLSSVFYTLISDRKKTLNPVVEKAITVSGKDEDWEFVYHDIASYLQESSNPYNATEEVTVQGKTYEIAKFWLSDIARRGEPDLFILNKELIPPPKEEERDKIIEKLAQLGTPEQVTDWTKIWNYRCKIALTSELMDQFHEKYKLVPVIAREGFYERVKIIFDTAKAVLICSMEGQIRHGSDESLDIHDLKMRYTAMATYDLFNKVVTNEINFANAAK